MTDIATAAILEVTRTTRQISERASHSSTRVHRDGDHFSFALPESSGSTDHIERGVPARLARHLGRMLKRSDSGAEPAK
ncbi:MAG: hypothetical protein ACRD26_03880 [Vicinamibacterales bacterium]